MHKMEHELRQVSLKIVFLLFNCIVYVCICIYFTPLLDKVFSFANERFEVLMYLQTEKI